jgi:hypothetical protein
MCFSSEASIRSLVTGLLGSFLCVSLGTVTDKIIGYFLGFVSLMQGIEYLLWQHQKCDNYNRVISVLGMVLNHLQPFILGIVVLLLNPKTPNYKLIVGLLVFYLIVILPYSYQFIKMKGTCTIKSENHDHLVWKWNGMPFARFRYAVFLFVLSAILILGVPNKVMGVLFAACGILMYSSSLVFYPREVAGALWCYYTAFIPIFYFLFRKLIPFSNNLVK